MKKFVATTALVFLFTSLAYGEEIQKEAQKPYTKLEAFQAKTGMVVVGGYSTVGYIKGKGTVTVDAREYRDASNPMEPLTGVSITVTEPGKLERENTAFIDSDEIDSLLAGLDYISKATKGVSPLDNFEVAYQTKGYFSVTVFINSHGERSAAVSAGRIGKTSAYFDTTQLTKLRQIIFTAKSKI